MMESFLGIARESAWWGWAILLLAALGTYAWRGLGVLLSGRLDQNSALFRWITCVTYAMVASLVIRIIVLPVGVLAQVPTGYRIAAAGTAFAIMVFRRNALVPAITTGTVMIMVLAWLA
jgi:branched-subunit amino acid transport protein